MYRLPCAALLLLLAACAHDDGRRHAEQQAAKVHLLRQDIQTRDFLLATWSHFGDATKPVRVYVEGDGLAWYSRYRLSDDPTPRRAIGLGLAGGDPSPNVVYLARPCQYVDLRAIPCDSTWWSDKRFAEEVIRGESEALDTLMRKAPGQAIHLVGYSGGAAIAVLMAARRTDVASLRTVAGNLDSEGVNRFHKVAPMPGSLNPIDYSAAIVRVPQIHFVGTDDRVVPATIASNFVAAGGESQCASLVPVQGASHEDGWVEQWPTLVLDVPACRP